MQRGLTRLASYLDQVFCVLRELLTSGAKALVALFDSARRRDRDAVRALHRNQKPTQTVRSRLGRRLVELRRILRENRLRGWPIHLLDQMNRLQNSLMKIQPVQPDFH